MEICEFNVYDIKTDSLFPWRSWLKQPLYPCLLYKATKWHADLDRATKHEPPCHSRCGTIKVLSSSKALIGSPHRPVVTSLYLRYTSLYVSEKSSNGMANDSQAINHNLVHLIERVQRVTEINIHFVATIFSMKNIEIIPVIQCKISLFCLF